MMPMGVHKLKVLKSPLDMLLIELWRDFKVTINPNVIPEHYPLHNDEDMFAH